MLKLGIVSRMSSLTLLKLCFLNLLSDPFGLPGPLGVAVVAEFSDRTFAVTNSALIVFLFSDPFGLPRPLGVALVEVAVVGTAVVGVVVVDVAVVEVAWVVEKLVRFCLMVPAS